MRENKFIKVTSNVKDLNDVFKKAYINVDRIEWFEDKGLFSRIHIVGQDDTYFDVQEHIDELKELIGVREL